MAAAADKDDGRPLLFDAVLMPHRSLTPLGFTLLTGFVAVVGFAAGAAYVVIGAWPVAGFTGIELALFYLLLRINYRGVRVHERVRLTQKELIVERFDRRKTMRWAFQPYWLRVDMADPPEPDSLVILSSHGRKIAIAQSLGLAERIDFARALAAVLEAQRGAPASPVG
jgi:uncharacterized membrane protein